VFQDLTLQETDEVNFVHKGKRSRPPDVDARLMENNKYCCSGVLDPSSSLCMCTGAQTIDEDPLTSNQNMARQVTCQLSKNKMFTVDQIFGQLYVHISEVFLNPTNQVQDGLTFIWNGKQGRPPDVDTNIIKYSKDQ